jgi:hypothetical protein
VAPKEIEVDPIVTALFVNEEFPIFERVLLDPEIVLLVSVALATFLVASLVLSTLPSPTIVFVIPETVPVKVGEAIGAFKSKAV